MENKINVILVDDEPLALDVLETFVEKMPDLKLVKRCSNAVEANEALKEEKIDIMFLDIQMPQISGIDFLKSLSQPPLVIFTTAHPDYALEGFELDAVDYLLKPISMDRFMKAVNKAMEKLSMRKEGVEEQNEFMFVKADKKLVKINYDDVLYIEGLKDYVIIKMEEGRVVTLQTLKSLEKKLPSHIFRRIHRSYILNLNKIKALVGNMVEIVEEGESKKIPIGKNYRDDLLEVINENKL